MRKLNEFKFETDWNTLPEVMSWDVCLQKGNELHRSRFDPKCHRHSDGRTQATIRNHFLRYPRKVRNQQSDYYGYV